MEAAAETRSAFPYDRATQRSQGHENLRRSKAAFRIRGTGMFDGRYLVTALNDALGMQETNSELGVVPWSTHRNRDAFRGCPFCSGVAELNFQRLFDGNVVSLRYALIATDSADIDGEA